jgi:urease accessory protein
MPGKTSTTRERRRTRAADGGRERGLYAASANEPDGTPFSNSRPADVWASKRPEGRAAPADKTVRAPVEWLPLVLQTTDSIFPTGSYAHSFGLEGIVQLGLVSDSETLAAFLEQTIAPLLERVELPAVAHSYQAARGGDLDQLCHIDELYGALKGTAELRQASLRIGQQRLAMLLQISPHPFLERVDAARRAGRLSGHSSVVFGVQAAVAGVPIDAALIAAYYQCLSPFLSASMKLIRIGQNGCQALLARFMRDAPAVAERARAVAREDMGWFAPGLDIASARHETAYTRLFIS